MNKDAAALLAGWLLLIWSQNQMSSAKSLGDECSSEWECREAVTGSSCNRGRCACQPFYARVNQTCCLPSTLLGYECQVAEQCSLKVANASCLDGVCRCVDGFLQFRKHTCLGPARPGNVCYSNAHCRLWTADSHCDFLIPNLFGRCQCNSPFKQLGDSCVRSAFQTKPTPTTSTTTTTSTPSTTEHSDIESNVIVEDTTKRPLQISTTQEVPTSATSISADQDVTASPPGPFDVTTRTSVSLRTTAMEPLLTTAMPSKLTSSSTSLPPTTTGIRKRVEIGQEAVSLGLPCVTDLQCKLADPSSKCLDGVCDCAFKINGTKSCSAQNRGCTPGTFQCRSTGTCISWFFVCDGRRDCSDGSDEDCKQDKCPLEAFMCKSSGKCISRAGRCDGVIDCMAGEDELDCQATVKNGCPPGTFECRDGKCLPEYEFCNAIIGCSDRSDEPSHICRGRARRRRSEYCPLRCGNGRCRSTAIACSGRDGCGDGSDEKYCAVCRCPIAQEARSL